MADVRKRLKLLQEAVQNHSVQTEGIMNLMKKYQDKAEQVRGEIGSIQQSLDHMVNDVAPAYGWIAPEHTDRTEEQIDADLAKLDKKIKAAQKDRNVHEVTARYHALLEEDKRNKGISKDLHDIGEYVDNGR